MLFRSVWASQIVVDLYKSFAEHINIPKEKWDKYHEPFKYVCKTDVLASNDIPVQIVDSVLPAVYFEKPSFSIKIKEHSIVASVVNKSERKAYEPDEQLEIASPVVLVKDLVTESVDGSSIYFFEAATNIVRQDKSAKVIGTPVVSVKIGDHCYYGLCDMGASASADRKSTRLNSSHRSLSRMPSSA